MEKLEMSQSWSWSLNSSSSFSKPSLLQIFNRSSVKDDVSSVL